jgi:hypothetical protein
MARAIGREEGNEPEQTMLLERWLGLGVSRVLRQACEADAEGGEAK